MPLVLFSWLDDQRRSFTVALDCSINETHVATTQVTEHQVEKGSNVTDHIRPMPLRLTVEALITNTPISTEALSKSGMNLSMDEVVTTRFPQSGMGIPFPPIRFKSLQFSTEFDRVRDAHTTLVDAMLHGTIMAITTSLREYSNMAATMLSVPRSVDTGAALRFSIEFQELRFATTATVAVPARQDKSHRGHQTPAEMSDEEKKKAEESVLNRQFGRDHAP